MADTVSTFSVPANYTDSGRLLGMVETRNAIEAGILVAVVGAPMMLLLNVGVILKISIMGIVLIPLAALAMFGIDGDSLFERLYYMIRFVATKRVVHMRRVGYHYAPETIAKKRKDFSKAKKFLGF